MKDLGVVFYSEFSFAFPVRHFPVRHFPVRHFPVRHFPVRHFQSVIFQSCKFSYPKYNCEKRASNIALSYGVDVDKWSFIL